MEAGALGVEITIRGKLTTERARYEKFRAGYLAKVGDPILKQMRVAVRDVQLKQGLFGINVKILPPNADFPDKPKIRPPQELTKEGEAQIPKEGREAADIKES
jgi:small subunit ribosomal protein S3